MMRGSLSTPLCKGGQGGFFLVMVRWDSAVMPPYGGILKAAPFGYGVFTRRKYGLLNGDEWDEAGFSVLVYLRWPLKRGILLTCDCNAVNKKSKRML